MTYHYDSTPEERRAAAILRRKGWTVHEPACPLCHGMGTVGTTSEWGEGKNWGISWSATPCPNGCPVPAAYYAMRSNTSSPR